MPNNKKKIIEEIEFYSCMHQFPSYFEQCLETSFNGDIEGHSHN